MYLPRFIQLLRESGQEKLKLAKQTTLKAPSIIGEDEKGHNVGDIMQHVRNAIREDDTTTNYKTIITICKGFDNKDAEYVSW